MIAAFFIKAVIPVGAVAASVAGVGYVYRENIYSYFPGIAPSTERPEKPSDKRPKRLSSSSHGFEYVVVSLVEKEGKTIYESLPFEFASSSNNKSYACRVNIVEKTQTNVVDDLTCNLYKLTNFDKDGSLTLDPNQSFGEDDLIKSEMDFEDSKHLVLQINQKVFKNISSDSSDILIVDKTTGQKTYFGLKSEFILKNPELDESPTNLFSVLATAKEADQNTAIAINQDTKFLCAIGDEPNKVDCKLYKYKEAQITNNLSHQLFNSLKSIDSVADDLKAGTYYVLDFLDKLQAINQLTNKDLVIYAVNGSTEEKLLTLNYDQAIYGAFKEEGKHLMYLQTPSKRVFLVKKTSTSDTGKIASPELKGGAEKNYRCLLEKVESPSPAKLANFDNSCKVFSFIQHGTQQTKYVDLSGKKFKDVNTEIVKENLADVEYFKLEIDSRKLHNFNWSLGGKDNSKIKVVPNVEPTDTNKHFIELEVVDEWLPDREAFGGFVNFLLVQVRNKSNKFKKVEGKSVKCKFYRGDSFDCDLYSPSSEKSVTNEESIKDLSAAGNPLTECDFSNKTKEEFNAEKNYDAKKLYLIHLKTPKKISEMLNKSQSFYMYVEEDNILLPGEEAYAASIAAKEAAAKLAQSGAAVPVVVPGTPGEGGAGSVTGTPGATAPVVVTAAAAAPGPGAGSTSGGTGEASPQGGSPTQGGSPEASAPDSVKPAKTKAKQISFTIIKGVEADPSTLKTLTFLTTKI